MPHEILIPEETRVRAADYLLALRSGNSKAGKFLAASLGKSDLATLTNETFLDVLINTKIPQIFAESAVAGDGSDWNLIELGLLGDISISVPVTVFDNGNHQAPVPHAEPFPGCFAGPFSGKLGIALQTVLERILATHGSSFPNIRGACFDPFNECATSSLRSTGSP